LSSFGNHADIIPIENMMRIVAGKVVEATHYGDEMIALMKLGVRPPV
jgi:hypothetical protein